MSPLRLVTQVVRLVATLLACTSSARGEWEEIPSTTLTGDLDSCAHCNNLPGPGMIGGTYHGGPCGENAEQREQCITAAAAGCEAEPKCVRLRVP